MFFTLLCKEHTRFRTWNLGSSSKKSRWWKCATCSSVLRESHKWYVRVALISCSQSRWSSNLGFFDFSTLKHCPMRMDPHVSKVGSNLVEEGAIPRSHCYILFDHQSLNDSFKRVSKTRWSSGLRCLTQVQVLRWGCGFKTHFYQVFESIPLLNRLLTCFWKLIPLL